MKKYPIRLAFAGCSWYYKNGKRTSSDMEWKPMIYYLEEIRIWI